MIYVSPIEDKRCFIIYKLSCGTFTYTQMHNPVEFQFQNFLRLDSLR